MKPTHYATRFPRVLVSVGDDGEALAERWTNGLNLPVVHFPDHGTLLKAMIPGRDALVVIRHDGEKACRSFPEDARRIDTTIPAISVSKAGAKRAIDEIGRTDLDGWVAIPISDENLESLRVMMGILRQDFVRPTFTHRCRPPKGRFLRQAVAPVLGSGHSARPHACRHHN